MFKRSQVEEAIAIVLEPGSAKPSSEMRTRLKRLLETDRSLGRNKRSPDPERGNFAFHGMDQPGRGLENWFTGYEAFALLTGLRLMRHGWPQRLAVTALRRVKPDLERHHARILKLDPAVLFNDDHIRQQAKPGDLAVSNIDPVYLVMNSKDREDRCGLKPSCHMPRPGGVDALYKVMGAGPDLDSDGTWDIDTCPLFRAG